MVSMRTNLDENTVAYVSYIIVSTEVSYLR